MLINFSSRLDSRTTKNGGPNVANARRYLRRDKFQPISAQKFNCNAPSPMFMGCGFLSPWGVPHARRFAGLAMRPAPQALPQVGVHARIEAVFEAGSMGLDGPRWAYWRSDRPVHGPEPRPAALGEQQGNGAIIRIELMADRLQGGCCTN